ncbi:MAG: hypothetical protein K9N06_08940 [Candidatus Cloacimonetes bacterium]|nr:hypothetical protein [Candidatus Cloacimonadota bacterium]
MSRYLAILFMLALFSLISAHPASQINAEFVYADSSLKVEYFHAVHDPASHYISDVIINLNGKEIINHKLSLQESDEGGKLAYRIPDAKPGDIIEIKTSCNKLGTKKLKITLPLRSIEDVTPTVTD